MTRRRIIAIVVVALLLIGGAAVIIYTSARNGAREGLAAQLDAARQGIPGRLEVSGFIEAEQIEVAAEIGGRVVEQAFEEGDEVAAGDVLLRLDAAIFEAQRDAAQAQLDLMIAQRDLLEATPRDEVIRQAQAQVAIAQAAVDAAAIAVADSAAIASNPQELELQLVDAQTQLAVASEQLTAAQVGFTAADRSLEMYYVGLDQVEAAQRRWPTRAGGLPLDASLAPQRYYEAQINLNMAQEAVQGAQSLVNALQDYADNPSALLAQVSSAQAQLETSQASLARSQAELEALRAGPGREDLAVADAWVEEARAALDAIEAQIERMTIAAPIDGIVLEQTIHVGELAAPGVPLITLANLDVVELTVYVPEDQFDEVSLNQQVQIRVDSFPGQTFEGAVVRIADEAEFTPRGVQTREERVNLVFAVKIQIENPDHVLKPGMPADAVFE
jgi:multidrug efflux pump subunit AcrA (membrane-fusion protein)